ncbi:uncharacterized protein B0T15DRAFT_569773 [Chaetomium strumarium]|uniref:Uncharacterized protein n=1 Tax=Chaetomium strumarium TaxID=1170767 RepID=A0AAJ0GME9_9PEZI|nr:hypothetical protein B0T15DRAFT_569773 [Chaetomium strumarium]
MPSFSSIGRLKRWSSSAQTSAQGLKRARADDLSQEHRPNKRIKSRGKRHRPSNFPLEFWDSLSKVPLTRRALRELDRRNSARAAPGPAAPTVHATDRARFARYSGPDLRHLRGCPEPKGAVYTMASNRSSTSSSQRTRSTKSTKATTAKPKKSSAYNNAFEQHLNDRNIYLNGKSKPNQNEDLYQPRPSLSPSKFSDGAFERFQDEHKHLGSKGDVMRKVISVITGNINIPSSGDVLFNNLESITDKKTVDAKPDFYDGARFHNGDPCVVKRQAGYDGAIGACAMHALQNYGAEEPAFDGNAYTYSSTYYAGQLQLFAHHTTPPAASGERPEYHMTKLRNFAMTDCRETFVQGATVLRNARDWAQRHRDSFIQAANAKARQSGVQAPPEPETTVAAAEQYDESTVDEFVDCEDFATHTVGTEDYAGPGDVDEESALPHYLEDDEPSHDSTPLGAEPAMSFVTSFTSGFTAQSQTSSKRNRDSPPSKSRPRKKHDLTKKRPCLNQMWYHVNEDVSCLWDDRE